MSRLSIEGTDDTVKVAERSVACLEDEIKEAFALELPKPEKVARVKEHPKIVIPIITNAISLARELLKGYVNTIVKTYEESDDEVGQKKLEIQTDKNHNLIVCFPCTNQDSYRFFEKYAEGMKEDKKEGAKPRLGWNDPERPGGGPGAKLLHFKTALEDPAVEGRGVYEYYRKHEKRGWVNGVNLCVQEPKKVKSVANGKPPIVSDRSVLPSLDDLYWYMNLELSLSNAGNTPGLNKILHRFRKVFGVPVVLVGEHLSKEERQRCILEAGVKQIPIVLEINICKSKTARSRYVTFRYIRNVCRWAGKKQIRWAGKDTSFA